MYLRGRFQRFIEMDGVNELYTVINLYYLGHYQQCINEASKIKVSGRD